MQVLQNGLEDSTLDGTYMVLLKVAPDIAFQRMVNRFLNTGRFISPDYALSIGDRPSKTYDILKRNERITSYAEIEASGPRETQPITGKGRTYDTLSGGRERGSGSGIHVPGVRDGSESPSREGQGERTSQVTLEAEAGQIIAESGATQGLTYDQD